MTNNNTELKDKIINHFQDNMLDGEPASNRAMINEQEVLEYILEFVPELIKALQEESNNGHWFAGGRKLDSYHNYEYKCNCGYLSDSDKVISSHVEWKIAAIQQMRGE